MTRTRNKLTIRKDANDRLTQIGEFSASEGKAIVIMPTSDDQGNEKGFRAMTKDTPNLHLFTCPIGGTWLHCVAEEINIESYAGYQTFIMNPLKNELKKKARSARCMVPGCNGKAIRCPETNSCYGCPRAGNLDTKTATIISLDQLMDALGEDRFDSEEAITGDVPKQEDGLCVADNPLDVIIRNYKRITEPERLKELHNRLRIASKGKTLYVPFLKEYHPTLEAIALTFEASKTDGKHTLERRKTREALDIRPRTFSKYLHLIDNIIKEYYAEIDMPI